MNYLDTFITVAEDCSATTGIVPQAKTDKKTVANIQYEMLKDHPYKYTQEDVLFGTFVRHKAVPAAELKKRGAAMRQEFFAKDQPCLRTSPLARTYGWGFHFDKEGKVALYAVDSSEYKKLAKQASKHLKAMRSSRK
ncbi:MAG: hypothetical protein HYS06_09120 [Methylocystis sp.]|nr:hypothetical protein [Methylocystis sp.]